uniref:Uncharacterized protein n=1 Tax=Peronospora matthiolae TaxID=2874970 RepID=A0AAV1V2F5_9STRA
MVDGIMHRHYDSLADTAAFLSEAPLRQGLDDTVVTAPINTDVVAAALKKMERGKAAGPDDLGNTIHRGNAFPLAPILAPLFAQ